MSEPHEDTDDPTLRPDPREEGGQGGRATRELAAQQDEDDDAYGVVSVRSAVLGFLDRVPAAV